MKLHVLALSAALFAATIATAQASPLSGTFNVNSLVNGVSPSDGGTPLDTGIFVNSGDSVTISSSPTDYWSINGGYGYNMNAQGMYWGTPTIASSHSIDPSGLNWGSLVYSLDGTNWGGAYTPTGTTVTFTAGISGELLLSMWDSVLSDNTGPNGTILTANVNVTPGSSTSASSVPEPISIALIGAGLAGLGVLSQHRRRRRAV